MRKNNLTLAGNGKSCHPTPQRKHSVTSNYRLHDFKASLIPFLLLMYDFSLGVFKRRHKSLISFENESLIVENKFFFKKSKGKFAKK